MRRLAGDLERAHPRFPSRAFIADATAGLLLDRGKHLARALAKQLPPEYPDALAVLLESLGPEHATEELLGVAQARPGAEVRFLLA